MRIWLGLSCQKILHQFYMHIGAHTYIVLAHPRTHIYTCNIFITPLVTANSLLFTEFRP